MRNSWWPVALNMDVSCFTMCVNVYLLYPLFLNMCVYHMVSIILCVFGGLSISFIHLWSIGLWVTRSATNILSWCTRGLGDSFQSRYIFGLDTYGGPIYLSDPCFVCGELLRKTRDIGSIWINFGGFFLPAATTIYNENPYIFGKIHQTIYPRCFGLPAARVNSLKSCLAASWGFLNRGF